MPEQGTFWDGIPTTPFRRLRRGSLSRAEAKRRAQQRFLTWYRNGGGEYVRKRRLEKWATDPDFVEKERARTRKHNRKRMGIVNPTDETRTGACEICKKVARLHMDHDHLTGERRGWLCVGCNTKLEWCLNNQEAIERYAGKAS